MFSNITQLICNIYFTGSPSVNPSSAELSPLSLDSSSALVSGKSSVSEASAGEYNHVAWHVIECGAVHVNMEGTALYDSKTCM